MVNGVIDQVRHRASQLFFVTQRFQRLINLKVELMLMLAERLRLAFHHLQHHRHINLFIERQRR